jgi:hypothetical protein
MTNPSAVAPTRAANVELQVTIFYISLPLGSMVIVDLRAHFFLMTVNKALGSTGSVP